MSIGRSSFGSTPKLIFFQRTNKNWKQNFQKEEYSLQNHQLDVKEMELSW